jgi:hypothetical protein
VDKHAPARLTPPRGSAYDERVIDSLGQLWSSARINAFAIELLAALLAIGGLLWHFGRPTFLWLYRSVWIPIREAQTGIPRRTLIVQAGDRRLAFWTDAKWGDEPMTMVRVTLHLTNVAKQPVQVSKARLRFRRGIFRAVKEGAVDVRHLDHSGQELYGPYPVLPSRMARAVGSWQISPPFQKADRPVVVRVCVIDQFGNRCWSDRIRLFRAGDVRRML